jgi:hypothetical protein
VFPFEGPALFAPAPPRAGLKLWLAADRGVTQASGLVSAWADQSGNGNDVVQSNGAQKPTFTASSIGGKPALTFAYNATNILLENTTSNPIAAGGDRYVFVVMKPGSGTTGLGAQIGGIPLSFRRGSPTYIAEAVGFGGDTYIYFDGTSSGAKAAGFTPTAGTPMLFEIGNVGTGSPPVALVNGNKLTLSASVGAGTVSSDSGTTGFTVGAADVATTVGMIGDIAEILVYDHVPSEAEASEARDYLNVKYSLPAPPQEGLQIWLKGDVGVTLSGPNVTNWADQSGNGNDYVQATGGKQPTVTASAINGLPAVTFNGTSQFLTSAAQIGGAKTVVMVRKLVSLPGASGLFDAYTLKDGSSNFSDALWVNFAGYQPYSVLHNFNVPTNSLGHATALDTSWHTAYDAYNGGLDTSASSYALTLDSSPQTVLASNTFGRSATDVPSLGARVDNTNAGSLFAPVQIAEFLVYDHVLSPTEQASVSAYLTAKYFGSPLEIDPATSFALAGDDIPFSAALGSGTGYVFSLLVNNSGASLVDHGDGTADYFAGSTTNVTDTVRVIDSFGSHADATVTVNDPLDITPPTTITVVVNGSYNFTATGGNGDLDWSVDTDGSGGAIVHASGFRGTIGEYEAGPNPGTDIIFVDDLDGEVVFATINVVAVEISPTPVNVPPLGSQLFTASLGTPPYTFAYVQNNSGGALVDNGDGTASYTAGSTPDVVDVVEVTDADSNIADATINVGDGVTTTPATGATIACGASQLFTAHGGSGTGYTFVDGGIMSGGSIVDHGNGTATYTAGNTATSTDTITVADDLGNTYELEITVPGPTLTPPGFPTPINVIPLHTIAFSASGGTGTGYVFSLLLNNSGGSINSSTGLYTAGSTGNVVDVVQLADGGGNTSTLATIDVGAALAISPTSVTLPPRGSQTFAATGGSGSGYVFTIHTNNSGGSINSSTGVYTAGATGSVTDTIRVTDGGGDTADAPAHVTAVLAISPTSITLIAGHSWTFGASGGSGAGIVFSLFQNHSGATINSGTGLYTAGATVPATDIVQVSDSLGNTAQATVSAIAVPPTNFFVQGVTLIGLSTLRLKFSYPPKAVDPTATNDALHPANYVLSGNDTTYVITAIPVLGDDRSIDCLLAAPLGFGKWKLVASNIVSADGGQTL